MTFHDQTPSEKLQLWQAARQSPAAREAAKLGVAWAFKCAVLCDGTRPQEISLTRLIDAQSRAAATAERIKSGKPLIQNGRSLGIMSNPQHVETALAMYQRLAQLEIEAQLEIATGRSDVAQTHS